MAKEYNVIERAQRGESTIEVMCLGESMMAVVPEPPMELRRAKGFALNPAGAESNVAMILSALGHRSAWASLVGQDELGHRLVETITTHGVDTSAVKFVDGAPTGVMFKDMKQGKTEVMYYRRHSAASLMDSTMIGCVRASGASILHLSGITPALSPSCALLTQDLLSHRQLNEVTTISFDVNYRPTLWSTRVEAAELLRRLANLADVVFVGLDEARALWEIDSIDELREVLPSPTRIVVKDAGQQATEIGLGLIVCEPAPPVQVLESVGAGDAFAAGWLSAYLRGGDANQRLKLGHLIAEASLLSTADVGTIPEMSRIAAIFPTAAEPEIAAHGVAAISELGGKE